MKYYAHFGFIDFVNVGGSTENYRIREVAETVAEVMPGTRVSFAEGSGPDKRSYQVDCSKARACCPRRGRSEPCAAAPKSFATPRAGTA
jgi:nucleoside-diphosphate-sugar epimerase